MSNILINSHVCAAGFYTENAMDNEYIRQENAMDYEYIRQFDSTMIFALVAVVVGLVFGGWSLCPSGNGSDMEEVNATGFVPAPDGEVEGGGDGPSSVNIV